jgi:hypothetical protein
MQSNLTGFNQMGQNTDTPGPIEGSDHYDQPEKQQ